jgi:hypothetical protein
MVESVITPKEFLSRMPPRDALKLIHEAFDKLGAHIESDIDGASEESRLRQQHQSGRRKENVITGRHW